MTLNLTTLQQSFLLDEFVQRWRDVAGSEALVLSPQGELLASSNGTPTANWQNVIRQASSQQPTTLIEADQKILAVPLTLEQEILGYLLALDAQDQDASLLAWLGETMTARMTDEIALAGMTDELIGAWDQLELIYKVTQNLTLSSDLMASLQSILQEIKKVVNTEDGFIVLQRHHKLDAVTTGTIALEDFYSETFLDHLIKVNQVMLCNETAACQQLWPDVPDGVTSLLATPLPGLEDEAKAALGLINKADDNFSAGDVKLLVALAQQVGTIIRSFLIHKKLIIEERLSRELEIAAEIQESLLPTDLPRVGGFSISVASIPASEVGGDFYDFVRVDDRNLTVVMGDVAGKGIPAAMLTSVTRTMLRVEAMRGESPQAIIQQANNVLHQDLGRADSFVTAFVVTIDTVKGTLTYASAGHTPTLLWRSEAQTTEQLRATAPPIGIFGYEGKAPSVIQLRPGDTLVLYTDGITEAQSPNGDLFGLNRLIYVIESNRNEAPENLQKAIQTEIANFRKNGLGRDDATLLILKMLPQADDNVSPREISTVIKTIDFSYPADIKYLGEISEKAVAACRQLPALPVDKGDDFIYTVELAISEICTNIIKHAYAETDGNLEGRITLLSNGIQIDFYDTGTSFDPNTVPQPKTDPAHLIEGGYGLHIVRQIMDIVSYEHYPKRGNHWYLLKLLPPS